MINQTTISEKLSYSTIRIECVYKDGSSGTGTGFFYSFCLQEDGTHYPAVVTNKHVMYDAVDCTLVFIKKGANGEPLDTEHSRIKVKDVLNIIVDHPEDEVDLCAFSILPFLNNAKSRGVDFFYLSLSNKLIPNQEDIDDMSAMEEILMIGYPNGLWDTHNNKPIFRKGITATHPKYDYCDRKEIMIDAACFPGSSGSPVFLFNEGVSKTKTRGLGARDRYYLLGVLYAGPQYNVRGDIEVVDVPTVSKPISISSVMINLGYVIKSSRLFELEDSFKKRVEDYLTEYGDLTGIIK